LLALAGLQAFDVFRGGKTRSLYHRDQFNFTKGAFGFADLLNTVSITYRSELLTPAFAGGLEGQLLERSGDFAGVINGIDVEEWNPANDRHLDSVSFSSSDAPDIVRIKKRQSRSKLRAWRAAGRAKEGDVAETPFANLRDDSILLGVVSRIDWQKAPILLGRIQDLSSDRALPSMAEEIEWRRANAVINPLEELVATSPDVQVVVLGNANDPYGSRFVGLIQDLQSRRPQSVMLFNGFDIPLSHLVFAASEIFLQPSRYEPAGLTQLVAMRYGCVPVARSVGGLCDTVIDERDPRSRSEANGFRFREELVDRNQMVNEVTAPAAFVAAVKRALRVIREDPQRWNQLVASGMRRDSSWNIPARQYVRLYHEALQRNLHRTFFPKQAAL
jgi:starch synthase